MQAVSDRFDEVAKVTTSLRGFDLFESLSDSDFERLVPRFRVLEFRDEDIVCHCPDAFHDVFVVLEGKSSLSRKRGQDLYPLEVEGTGAVINAPRLVDPGE